MRVVVLLAFLATFVISSAALGVCLLNDYSVEAEYARSVAVVVAEVVSQRNAADAEDDKSYGGVSYKLKIKESFRGSRLGTVDVFSENSSGRFPMETGKAYILFLYEEQGRLSADNCGNSGLVSQKQDVMATLHNITKPSNGGRKPNSALSPPHSVVTALAQSGKRRAAGR
jgi:hypothetical protein